MIDRNTEDWFQAHEDEFKDPNQLEFDFTVNEGKPNELTFRIDPELIIKLKWKYIQKFRVELIELSRNSRVAHDIMLEFDHLLDCAER
jgi:hypothetical protein